MRAAFAMLLASAAIGARAQITIDNIEAGAKVRYPLVALRGTAKGESLAVGASWASAVRFPVIAGKWAGFVELKRGPNMVLLQAGRTTVKFKLDYEPMTTPYKVQVVFVKSSDGEDKYYTNQKGDKFPIRQKLDVMMKFLQSGCAEAMNKQGYGRKTFNLNFDSNGVVVVNFVTLPKTAAEMRAMDNNQSWSYISDVIKQVLPEETNHWLALMGYTTFDPVTKKTLGHYALGGGAQAAFGTGSMGWWPANFKEAPSKMSDPFVLDDQTMFEDSAFRSAAWAEVSTAYGAMLHELGHTFGLPHTADPWSVMSRGFDHFSRWFMVQDPPTKKNPLPTSFTLDQTMEWDPWFAARLNLEPWFQPDGQLLTPKGEPKITIDGDNAVIDAPDGIRLWGAERDDLPHVWEDLGGVDAPISKTLSIKDLRARLKTDKEFRIVVMDSLGQQANVDVKP